MVYYKKIQIIIIITVKEDSGPAVFWISNSCTPGHINKVHMPVIIWIANVFKETVLQNIVNQVNI